MQVDKAIELAREINDELEIHPSLSKRRLEKIASIVTEYQSAEREAAVREVAQCAQAVLTALNVGDVQSESPLHLKLREVMIAYRAAAHQTDVEVKPCSP